MGNHLHHCSSVGSFSRAKYPSVTERLSGRTGGVTTVGVQVYVCIVYACMCVRARTVEERRRRKTNEKYLFFFFIHPTSIVYYDPDDETGVR